GYDLYRGPFTTRYTGSIVADRQGQAVAYALFNLEPRGQLFIVPGTPVYEGMIIGEHNRENDINVNPCKEKKLTNVRAAGRDENVVQTPPRVMTLERAIHFIREDEMIEVTPKSLRLRKAVLSGKQRYQNAAAERKAP
ncbi:MAG: translational GTPase TypA, partial [Nitrospirota bacterium]